MLILVVITILFAGWRYRVRQSPEYALEVVAEIETREDAYDRRGYITPQGMKLMNHVFDTQKGPAMGGELIYEKCQVQGALCYFPFKQPETNNAGYMVFEKHGKWQFHDLVITKIEGKEVEMSLAWAIDHPFQAALKGIDWDLMLEYFLKGFAIGMGAG